MLLIVAFLVAWQKAPIYAKAPTTARPGQWMDSSLCQKLYGVPLINCDRNGKKIPLESTDWADDRGHALLGDFYTFVSGELTTIVWYVRLNVVINALALLLLALIAGQLGSSLTTAAILVVGTSLGIPGPVAGPDTPAAYFGIFCLVLTLPLALIYAGQPFAQRRLARWLIAAGSLALAAALLLRGPLGIIGLPLTALVALVQARQRGWRALYPLLILAACLQLNGAITWARNKFCHVPPSPFIARHGFADGLFVGLGAAPNPWGIDYSDGAGLRAVQKLDPKILFRSPEYFAAVGQLYRDLVVHYPGTVLGIYVVKLREAWQLPLPIPFWYSRADFRQTDELKRYDSRRWEDRYDYHNPEPYEGGVFSVIWALLLIVGLTLAKLFGRLSTSWTALANAGLITAATAAVLFQGVLVVPHFAYLYPAQFGSWLAVILAFSVRRHEA